MSEEIPPFDSILLVSFGGPEGPDDVIPFLENVLRGKNVPRERMLEVAEHYQHFGGVSPINAQNRDLIDALHTALSVAGIEMPVYWGNRNWDPLLTDTITKMRDEGARHALAFFTSMFSCYSGCRQYRENIAAARAEVGPQAPMIDKLRFGFNHPRFIEAQAERVRAAMAELAEETSERPQLVFTAHSIPMTMSDNCDYVKQLNESCRLVAERVENTDWKLVYQSRSGPPHQPWLEPDICDYLKRQSLAGELKAVIVIPIGFVSDHMEVMFDLDEEATAVCRELSLPMRRAGTVGCHPEFIGMIVDLIRERLDDTATRAACGSLGPWHDVCPSNCCLYPVQRPGR